MSEAERRSSADTQDNIRDRLDFFGLTPTTLRSLKAVKPTIDRATVAALDAFYARAAATPDILAFFPDRERMMAHARAAQIEHWKTLSSGELEGRAVQVARSVGRTHARRGVSIKWYAAGYGFIVHHILTAVVTELWPKSALRGGGDKMAEAAQAISALARIVLLDFDLATTAYLDELDARRREADAKLDDMIGQTNAAVETVRMAIGRLAANDLTCDLPDGMSGPFKPLRDDFNQALGALRETLGSVAASLSTLTTSTHEIAGASRDLSKRTEQEASNLEESSAALEEVSTQVGKTAEGAQVAQLIVTQAGAEAQQSNAIVAEAISAMGRIEKSSSDIGKIIGAVDEIAFQTSLLALNAGVEAARAGEAGRGFAVVAAEVRGLASRSADAAKEIKALVGAASAEVAGGVKLVSATGEALARIGAKVAEMNGVVADILAATRQQAASLVEIKSAVSQLSDGTQRNAAMAEESTAASQALARETAGLADMVGRFDVGARSSPRRAPEPAPRAARVAGGGWREY